MAQGNARSLQERIAQLGLTPVLTRIARWASVAEDSTALAPLVDILEDAWWALIADLEAQVSREKIEGRTPYTNAKTGVVKRAARGARREADDVCAELVRLITRIRLDLLGPSELERVPCWDPKQYRGWDAAKYAEMASGRVLWIHDDRLRRAGPFLLPALPILAEPRAIPPRKRGSQKQAFQRAAVEKALTEALSALVPADPKSRARDFAVLLLKKLAG